MSPLEIIQLVEHLLDNQDEVGYLSPMDLRRMTRIDDDPSSLSRIEEEQNDEYDD